MKTMNCPVTKFIDSKMQKFDPLWQAQNGVGGLRSRYYDKTGVAKYREWRGLHDTMVDYRAWLKNVMSMAAMVASAPIPCLKGFWEYRWMGSFLGTFMFIDRLFEGYRGKELRIAHMNMHAIVQSLTKRIAFALKNDKRLGGGPDSDNIVPMDEVIPALIMKGFKGLTGFPLQTLPEFIICDVDQHIEPYYIDGPNPSACRRTCAPAARRRPAWPSTMTSPFSARPCCPPTCPATPAKPPPCSSAAVSACPTSR